MHYLSPQTMRSFREWETKLICSARETWETGCECCAGVPWGALLAAVQSQVLTFLLSPLSHIKRASVLVSLLYFFNVTEFLSFSFFFNFLVDSVFCLNEDDRRWKTMCTHPLNRNQGDDRLLGMEECRSPFGNYELHIPVDEELSCSDDMPITHLNCRDLDVSYRSCN